MLWIYSLAHFCVDFGCAYFIYSRFLNPWQWTLCLVLYNFCAFAMQAPLGLLGDRIDRNAIYAAAGCVIGRAIETRVLALLQSLAAQMELPDTRYSFTQLALIRTLAFDPKPSAAVYLAAGGLLLLGAALSALLFTVRLFADPAPKRRQRQKKTARGGAEGYPGCPAG